jgi:hypothetical protein
MAVRYGPRLFIRSCAPIWNPSRPLLLGLSGTVRKCKKEVMRVRISKWVRKWGFPAMLRVWLLRLR